VPRIGIDSPEPATARAIFRALKLDPHMIPVLLGYVTAEEMELQPPSISPMELHCPSLPRSRSTSAMECSTCWGELRVQALFPPNLPAAFSGDGVAALHVTCFWTRAGILGLCLRMRSRDGTSPPRPRETQSARPLPR
jgi:hypothetical protein